MEISMQPFMYFVISVWIVHVTQLVHCTQGLNFCDADTQIPNNTIMETFERPTEDLACVAQRESSVIAELYHCVNGTGVLLESCRRGQSTNTRRVSINCSVTIHTESENVSETFYCIERMLFSTTNQLSAHFSVVVASSDAIVTVPVSSLSATTELFTSNQPSTGEINGTTRRNGGRSKNMQESVLLVALAALLSILSTNFVTSSDCYQIDCMIIENLSSSVSTFVRTQKRKTQTYNISDDKQTFYVPPHHKFAGWKFINCNKPKV